MYISRGIGHLLRARFMPQALREYRMLFESTAEVSTYVDAGFRGRGIGRQLMKAIDGGTPMSTEIQDLFPEAHNSPDLFAINDGHRVVSSNASSVGLGLRLTTNWRAGEGIQRAQGGA